MTKNLILAAVAGTTLALSQTETSALQYIDGSLLIVGTGSASVSGGLTTVTPSSPMHVIVGVGDYSSIAPGSAVDVSPFQYSGNGLAAVLQFPITPEWTITVGPVTYSFDLSLLQSATFVGGGAGAGSSIAVSGAGTAHITGFLDTPATWSFSGTGTGFSFAVGSEQTTALAPNVPETGSSLTLLALAVGGVALARRKLS